MTSDFPTQYCANHPQTETTLRCNRCEKPICTRCAVLTPTGYRCKECVRGQQIIFDTAQWYDYPLAFGIVALLTFLGSLLVSFVGFFTIFLAPFAGMVVGEAARLIIRRRRSRLLFQMIVIAAITGCLPLLLLQLANVILFLSQSGVQGMRAFFPLLWQSVYAFMVTTTIHYRLTGINIRA